VLRYGQYSVSSDVWSYGVLAWQVFTFNQRPPYWTMTDADLVDALTTQSRDDAALRLHLPPVCKQRATVMTAIGRTATPAN